MFAVRFQSAHIIRAGTALVSPTLEPLKKNDMALLTTLFVPTLNFVAIELPVNYSHNDLIVPIIFAPNRNIDLERP